jgi:hypothetical protein
MATLSLSDLIAQHEHFSSNSVLRMRDEEPQWLTDQLDEFADVVIRPKIADRFRAALAQQLQQFVEAAVAVDLLYRDVDSATGEASENHSKRQKLGHLEARERKEAAREELHMLQHTYTTLQQIGMPKHCTDMVHLVLWVSSPFLSLARTHARTHARTPARTHARPHARTHALAHAKSITNHTSRLSRRMH